MRHPRSAPAWQPWKALPDTEILEKVLVGLRNL
ncbi:hypothetical protein [Nocardia aobensis]|nr:hypothetical protein [Nocardia aobensis]